MEVGGWVAWTQVQGLGAMSLFPTGLAGGQVRCGDSGLGFSSKGVGQGGQPERGAGGGAGSRMGSW